MKILALSCLAWGFLAARASVVINEVFYHAPGDLPDLQWIELHNAGAETADISGWKFTKGVKLEFRAGTEIAPGGFLLCVKDEDAFQGAYRIHPAAVFAGSLKRKGERLELSDASSKVVDSMKYDDTAPWPVTPDGYSSSLERISPVGPGDTADNWAPSPPAPDLERASGTPGKPNATFSKTLPPVIRSLKSSTNWVAPDQPFTVVAEIAAPEATLASVALLVRVAGQGDETAAISQPMKRTAAGTYEATVPGQTANHVVRLQVKATASDGSTRVFPHPHDLRPAVSVLVAKPFAAAKIPQVHVLRSSGMAMPHLLGQPNLRQREGLRGLIGTLLENPRRDGRERTACIYVDADSGRPELFDFVSEVPRPSGLKVRFHRDRPLRGMTSINLVRESTDRMRISEPLAFDLYRRAGMAVPQTGFIRLHRDGSAAGLFVLCEQPNKAFLRRAGLNTDGNLYKLNWRGQNAQEQHELKTHTSTGHRDLLEVLDRLNSTEGADQWEVIKEHFVVEQVANYFAVNMLLGHWDGFFNNHYAYHDIAGTGRWSLYPWDQDKTFGSYDMLPPGEVFVSLPLTYAQTGDRPPGWRRRNPPTTFFETYRNPEANWWRQPGHFSGPLLANATFRELFITRIRELLEEEFSEKKMFAAIDALKPLLADEVPADARAHGMDPKEALDEFEQDCATLKRFVTGRRRFLLGQAELRETARFDRNRLK
jgi:hypothetical protein